MQRQKLELAERWYEQLAQKVSSKLTELASMSSARKAAMSFEK